MLLSTPSSSPQGLDGEALQREVYSLREREWPYYRQAQQVWQCLRPLSVHVYVQARARQMLFCQQRIRSSHGVVVHEHMVSWVCCGDGAEHLFSSTTQLSSCWGELVRGEGSRNFKSFLCMLQKNTKNVGRQPSDVLGICYLSQIGFRFPCFRL